MSGVRVELRTFVNNASTGTCSVYVFLLICLAYSCVGECLVSQSLRGKSPFCLCSMEGGGVRVYGRFVLSTFIVSYDTIQPVARSGLVLLLLVIDACRSRPLRFFSFFDRTKRTNDPTKDLTMCL